MKIIISENQLRTIIESENKISDKKLKMYKDTIDELGLDYAATMLDKEPYELIEMGVVESYDGDLDLNDTQIKSLGNLKYVGGNLDLQNSQIKSLGKLKEVKGYLDLINSKKLTDLGNLISVKALILRYVPLKSLGKLKEVKGTLYIEDCPLSKLSDEEIRSQVEIKGKIYRG